MPRRPAKKANNVVNKGTALGEKIFNEPLARVDKNEFAPAFQQTNAAIGGILNKANTTSTELQDIIARRQAGLGGLNSPELTALREQGQAGINRQSQTGAREIARRQAMGGAGGGIANAQNRNLRRDTMMAQGNLERDLTLANVAERNKRLDSLQGLIESRDAQQLQGQIAGSQLLNNSTLAQADFNQGVNAFNASQQAKEIAAKTAATGTGVGLIQGYQDKRQEKNRFEDLLSFLREQEESKISNLSGLGLI